MDPDKLAMITAIGPMIGIGIVSISAGWVLTTWMRIKNGYPLDGAWGQAVYPKNDREAVERVKLLSQENAQLRAELGSIKTGWRTWRKSSWTTATGLHPKSRPFAAQRTEGAYYVTRYCVCADTDTGD